MKKLITLLLLFLSPLSAQESEEFTVTFDLAEYVKSLVETDCETFIRQGNQYSKIAIESAMNQNWDQAFYHDEIAFDSYMKAFGHCDDENKETAKVRLDENLLAGKWLTCTYHTVEAHNASVRANAALANKDESAVQALNHAKDSLASLDSAIRFCEYDQNKVDNLTKIRVGGLRAIALIEFEIKLVEESGH